MRHQDVRRAGRSRRPAPGRIRREIGWILALKLTALLLLWALFFSPAHRLVVDSDATGQRLAVKPTCAAVLAEECKEKNGD